MDGNRQLKDGNRGSLESVVEQYSTRMLAAYRENPPLVDEHAGLEENIAQGGYGRRQLLELIQNGADQLIQSPGGRIHVVLTETHLYCANEGLPIADDGVGAILLANVSPKRADEIGRFGLGFKSVLGVTSCPEFYSQPVSFGFNESWAAEQIAAVAGDHDAYPVLRVAQLRDLDAESRDDPILREMMTWATTVVRLPLDRGGEWLADDLADFDAEFLLFSPHVGELRLEQPSADVDRVIRMRQDGDDLVLEEDGVSQRWRVFRAEHTPSEAARRQAGKLQHREKLPIVWAVPTEGKLEVGQFWAFFPLRDLTTLSGIANAPWQVNDDRTGLLENSALNRELLEALVALVFRSLEHLVPADDPGRVLDLMPARGREARCWGDEVLTNHFNGERVKHAVVPDQLGKLRKIDVLKAPPANIPTDAQVAWSKHPRRPTRWVHPSASTSPTRRNRVGDILTAAGKRAEDAATWLDALVADDDAGIEESAAAILVAATAARHDDYDPEVEGLCEAQVALNDSEEWSMIHPDWIWVDDGDGSRAPVIVSVHPEVVAVDGVREALRDIGIQPVTPMREFEALLSETEQTDGDTWELIWSIAREIGDDESAAAVLREHVSKYGPYCVRAGDGKWRRSNEVLLPGRVFHDDETEGQRVVVDVTYHADDLELLRKAGMSDGPVGNGDVDDDPKTKVWHKRMLDDYERYLNDNGSRPSRSNLEIDRTTSPQPIGVMPLLEGEHNARFCALLLEAPGAVATRRLQHRNQSRYPIRICDSPTVWAIKQWGLLSTSLPDPDTGSTATLLRHCVSPALDEHRSVLPVADVTPEAAERLGLWASLEEIPKDAWVYYFGIAVRSSPEQLGGLFALALEAGIEPLESIPLPDGRSLNVADIVVAGLRDDLEILVERGHRVAEVTNPRDVERLVEEWGVTSAHTFIETTVVPVDPADPVAVLDLFPDLAALDRGLVDLKVVCCDEVVVERADDKGSVEETVPCRLSGGTLFVAASPDDEESILQALDQLHEWGLDEREREVMLNSRKTAAGRELAVRVSQAESIAEKVTLAVGVDALRRRLNKQVIDEMTRRRDGDLAELELAELALSVHGVELLQHHKDDLAANGLDVPSRWGGSRTARRFVLDLGFPKEFAGFKRAARDSMIEVPGPISMKPLHDFQSEAAANIRGLVRAGRGRGMLSLPTGAGKTRTAVQALIESMADGELEGPILWVAESDELCEQAVTAWTDNWRAVGPQETLRLGRLWSGNAVEDLDDPHQVVVATTSKLQTVIPKAEYKWLSQANAIVVDEAHRAITPEYTRILDWLGMGRGKERAPLVGLSATPYRGVSEEQTKALINRFNGTRLDTMGDDPYGRLQDMGVLSQVEHKLLDGADLVLTPGELDELRRTRRLPPTVVERVVADKGRNEKILDSIRSLDDDHTVLLFAASVAHAELLAGLLSAEGIPSRAISGRTDRGARQHYISQFRAGEIRVLTNFGVLTEGFDAPAVRAVYVARPTYSPNLYSQMIGRGLRGPKNGGKETCLIVNVADTLAQFGEELAFKEWEHLWADAS